MPIYAYRCASCGHALDALQKLSDPLLTVCPACGQPALQKQLTAAGFQLKGSGWYATDFRGNNGAAKPEGETQAEAAKGGEGDAAKTAPAADAKPAEAPSKPAAEPAAPSKSTAAPAAAGGSGSTPSA